MPEHDSVDLLVVGSGPAGSTYARVVGDALPSASILVVEAGPATSRVPGKHAREKAEDERIACELALQCPDTAVAPGGAIPTSTAANPTPAHRRTGVHAATKLAEALGAEMTSLGASA